MKKEDFYFGSHDGQNRIHGVRYLPDAEEVTAILQIVHGMAEYIERYEEFARFLTDRGILVTGEDHLGHGKSIGSDGAPGYFCEQDSASVVVENVHCLRQMNQERCPEVPYFILGHSMGSFITRNYMAEHGEGLAGVIIMGTGMPPRALIKCSRVLAALLEKLQGPKHVSRLLHKATFGAYPADWLTRDKEIANGYLADPLCGFIFTVNGFQTLFELIDRLYDREKLEKIPKDLPVLMVSGWEDPVGDYGKGVKAAFDSLKSAGLDKLEMKLYKEDRHELLNELDRDKVMEDIYEWLRTYFPTR